jgi:hypothetical protein
MVSFIAMSKLEATSRNETENNFVNAFVVKDKRTRWSELLAGKRRAMILGRLAGWDDFIPELMEEISRTMDVLDIQSLLNARGISSTRLCWVISDWREMDMKAIPLNEALERVVGLGLGTVICILPGSLSYYESEGGRRFLLEKRPDR